MKIRAHREMLVDSMDTVEEIEPTKEAVAKYFETNSDNITVEKYEHGIDERIGWNTHIVCIDGNAMGFTDGGLCDMMNK